MIVIPPRSYRIEKIKKLLLTCIGEENAKPISVFMKAVNLDTSNELEYRYILSVLYNDLRSLRDNTHYFTAYFSDGNGVKNYFIPVKTKDIYQMVEVLEKRKRYYSKVQKRAFRCIEEKFYKKLEIEVEVEIIN